jgi:hypothetical protein
MDVQSERLASLCEELKLPSIAEQYGPIAQEVARKELPFTDFLERVLKVETQARQIRSRDAALLETPNNRIRDTRILRCITDKDWRGIARRSSFRLRGFFHPLIPRHAALPTAVVGSVPDAIRLSKHSWLHAAKTSTARPDSWNLGAGARSP